MTNIEGLRIGTRDGTCELELLPGAGGTCNGLRLVMANGERVNIIAGVTSEEEMRHNHYYRGVALYPYANRLDAGRYTYNNQPYQFDLNEPETHNSLHGFLFNLTPEVRDITENDTDAGVALHFSYAGQIPGYPFPADISLTYRLSTTEGLKLTMRVTNLHDATVPVGIGWHPYFTLGTTVDDLKLKLPEVRRVEVDERMLPVGLKSEFRDLDQTTRIGSMKLDCCMELVELDRLIASTVIYSPVSGNALEVWQDVRPGTGTQQADKHADCHVSYTYIHVFIPPDRESIAIEPVSCGINAFNTGEGLVHLAPGQTLTGECGVRPLYSTN